MRSVNAKVAVMLLAALVASGVWSGAAWSAEEEDRPTDHAEADRAGFPGPVIGTHEFMEVFNKPLYKKLKRVMRRKPDNHEQWEKIEHAGYAAAEIANLIVIREGEHASEEPEEWREYAGGLQRAGKALAKATQTQDFQAARQAYGTLIDRCNACHDHFAPDDAPNLEM